MHPPLDHRSFVIRRDLPGSPAHAFRFFADHALKRRWNACHPDWEVIEDRFDFRVDGVERLVWRMPDGTVQTMIAHLFDIAPRERIVYAYVMRTDDRTISSSLVTIAFEAKDASGDSRAMTAMTYTEQAAFADARDGDCRETGTGAGYDRLVAIMAATA